MLKITIAILIVLVALYIFTMPTPKQQTFQIKWDREKEESDTYLARSKDLEKKHRECQVEILKLRKKILQGEVVTIQRNSTMDKIYSSDKEHWERIINDINPDFNNDFGEQLEVVETPKTIKDAQYFRDKKEEYLIKMKPVWEEQGTQMAFQIIDEIEEHTKKNPFSSEYRMNYDLRSPFIELHPYSKMPNEAKIACKYLLREWGFHLDEWIEMVQVKW